MACTSVATLAQLVEHVTENHGVPSSILGGGTIEHRLSLRDDRATASGTVSGAGVAQLVEHVTRNDGVTGSIPVTSSIPLRSARRGPRAVTRAGAPRPAARGAGSSAVATPVASSSGREGPCA